MAISHAKSFVSKFFEDDEFTKMVIRNSNFAKNESNKEEAENKKMVSVANQLGFDFDEKEYVEASKEYMNNLGGWDAARKVFHIVKIASYVYNEK